MPSTIIAVDLCPNKNSIDLLVLHPDTRPPESTSRRLRWWKALRFSTLQIQAEATDGASLSLLASFPRSRVGMPTKII